MVFKIRNMSLSNHFDPLQSNHEFQKSLVAAALQFLVVPKSSLISTPNFCPLTSEERMYHCQYNGDGCGVHCALSHYFCD